ncbi:MAG: PmoA family protein [Prolixibacteraceae bacterium]|nr:PmoA family protein [Prolixibacteraceae bacterium]
MDCVRYRNKKTHAPIEAGYSHSIANIMVNSQEKKVDVLIDGMLFTSYIYPEEVKNPVLWTIVSSCVDTVTRCFSMLKKSGERTDHSHHVGMWLNYENVNGLDLWNNSEAIPLDRRDHYGKYINVA